MQGATPFTDLTVLHVPNGAAFERCAMTRLWCVKGKLNDGEIYLRADAVDISPHGELAFYRENGSRSLVLAEAPGMWFATRRCLTAAPRMCMPQVATRNARSAAISSALSSWRGIVEMPQG
jgi:hypothetical protein